MTSVVLLSGWGIDARIWHPLAPYWPGDWRVLTPDWPGYRDHPPLTDPGNLDELAGRMADSLPADSLWVGWSLGGLLAACLLNRLPRPRALVMLGMGDRFINDQQLGQSMTHQALNDFIEAFERNSSAAWHHFIRWQLRGEPQSRQALSQLRSWSGDTPPADSLTLRHGLRHLQSLNVGPALHTARCPVYRLRGIHDPLVPPHEDEHTLKGCGHCPQLSQPKVLVERLLQVATPAQVTER